MVVVRRKFSWSMTRMSIGEAPARGARMLCSVTLQKSTLFVLWAVLEPRWVWVPAIEIRCGGVASIGATSVIDLAVVTALESTDG
jgi:hypothetical protein